MPNIEKTSANKEENQQRIAAHYESVHDLFTKAQSTYLEHGGNPEMLGEHLKNAFDKSFNILKIKAYLAYREAIEVSEIRKASEAIEHENDDGYIQEKELNIEELDKWIKFNCSKPKNDLIDPTNPVHIIRRDNSGMPFLVRKPFCDNLERHLQFRIIVNQWIARYEHGKSVTLNDFKSELLRLVEIHDYKYKISKQKSDKLTRFYKPINSASNEEFAEADQSLSVKCVSQVFHEPTSTWLERYQDIRDFNDYLKEFIVKLDPTESQELIDALNNLANYLKPYLELANYTKDNNNYKL